MEKVVLKTLVVITGVVFMISIAGCEEEQQVSNTKKTRLIAAKNMQLTRQLKQRDKEIEELKRLYSEELARQKKLREKCLEEKKELENQLHGKFKSQLNELFTSVSEENAKLQEENQKLKTQIEELKTKLEELKGS